LRPAFGFVRGTLDITLRVLDVVPGSSVRYHVHGKGIGSSNEVEAALHATPADGGSHVHWTADVTQLGGLLKAIPPGLIRASAQKVIDDVMNQVQTKLGATAAG
jgi:carbon monoxide dehydrogenase subunit G